MKIKFKEELIYKSEECLENPPFPNRFNRITFDGFVLEVASNYSSEPSSIIKIDKLELDSIFYVIHYSKKDHNVYEVVDNTLIWRKDIINYYHFSESLYSTNMSAWLKGIEVKKYSFRRYHSLKTSYFPIIYDDTLCALLLVEGVEKTNTTVVSKNEILMDFEVPNNAFEHLHYREYNLYSNGVEIDLVECYGEYIVEKNLKENTLLNSFLSKRISNVVHTHVKGDCVQYFYQENGFLKAGVYLPSMDKFYKDSFLYPMIDLKDIAFKEDYMSAKVRKFDWDVAEIEHPFLKEFDEQLHVFFE